MVPEEVDNVWGAVQNLPQEAMASSHVTTRKSEKGDHMQAVMTVAQREAKEKEQKEKEKKEKEAHGKATKLRHSTRTLGRNPSNASSCSGAEVDCLGTAFKNMGIASRGVKRSAGIGRTNSGNGSPAAKKQKNGAGGKTSVLPQGEAVVPHTMESFTPLESTGAEQTEQQTLPPGVELRSGVASKQLAARTRKSGQADEYLVKVKTFEKMFTQEATVRNLKVMPV